MEKLTSIRISKKTLRWIHRLKGLFERYYGKSLNMDNILFLALTFSDWRYAVDAGETKKDYIDYVMEIEKLMGSDWSFEGSIIEEFSTLQELIKSRI